MERYVCTHCGHHFESQPKESVVCPKCFWSTSVEKEETDKAAGARGKEGQASSSLKSESGFPAAGLRVGLVAILVAVILGGIVFAAVRHLRKQDEILRKIENQNAQVIWAKAPELALTPEEREILERKVTLELKLEVDPAEEEILSRRFLFRPPGVRGLPTPPWDEKQFELFLKGEEAHYKLPLEWSYRRKLKKLFQRHYAAAGAAFEAKETLKARDEWIRSLNFPIYQNDVKKHRGVVLTMLRPYVNDTLSRIGAMNALLMEKDLYALEEKIRSSYENLQSALTRRAWDEANAALLEVTRELDGVNQVPKPVQSPPLPEEVAQIDEGIRTVLLAQAASPEPSAPDWESLWQDLSAKERVIQLHLPEFQAQLARPYEEALGFIQGRQWKEAREVLQKIDFPEELVRDAREKVAVLDKLLQMSSGPPEGASLDSEWKSG